MHTDRPHRLARALLGACVLACTPMALVSCDKTVEKQKVETKKTTETPSGTKQTTETVERKVETDPKNPPPR